MSAIVHLARYYRPAEPIYLKAKSKLCGKCPHARLCDWVRMQAGRTGGLWGAGVQSVGFQEQSRQFKVGES